MNETSELTYVTYIKTTPGQLWRALVEPAFTKRYWFGARIESTWEPGAPVGFWFPVPADEAEKRGMQRNENGEALSDIGTVLVHHPYETLSYTFHPQWDEAMRADAPTNVTFTLERKAAVVKLNVLHQQITNRGTLLQELSEGWPAILSSLKSLLETGEALTIGGSSPEEASVSA